LGCDQLRHYRPFTKARKFVRGLHLKSENEWDNYIKSKDKPVDIPNNPDHVYAGAGWKSWGDWLGTGVIASSLYRYRSFGKARAFVHRLNLGSVSEWKEYCKSGDKPADIPSNPNRAYANIGWAGFGDWLGTNASQTEHAYIEVSRPRSLSHPSLS
jgi:hypothetical protein